MKNKKEIKVVYVPKEQFPTDSDFGQEKKDIYDQTTNTIYLVDNLSPNERKSALKILTAHAKNFSEEVKRK